MASTANINLVNSYYQGILRFTPPASLAAVFAAELDAGTLTTTQLQAQLLSDAQTSSIPALVSYDIQFNTTPNSGGLTYLTAYSSALQSGNYTFNNGSIQLGTVPNQFSSIQFSLQNVYVNLGATFAGSSTSTFAATYGSLDRATFVSQIYTQIFGVGPATSTQTFLLNNFQYYLNYAGSEIGARGAIAGLLLSVAETNNLGIYPAAANALLTAAAVSGAAGADTATYGTELIAGYGASTINAVVLKPGPTPDNVVGNLITGDLTPFLFNGVGPTLNVGDVITGTPGLTNNTLVINDQFGTGASVIPSGVKIANVQNIVLNTQSNAGAGASAVNTGGVFDLTTGTTTGSNITGVKTVTVTSAGQGLDNVRVDPGSVNAVDVTVNHQHINGGVAGGGVTVLGGRNITVTDGDNAGAVTLGSITTTGQNGVPLNATGTIKVTEFGNDNVTALGGTTVGITTAGTGFITVGAPFSNGTYPTDEPVQSVTIADNASGQAGVITVFGSAPVTNAGTTTINATTVSITEAALVAGAIAVGAVNNTAGIQQSYAPGGAVSINVAAQIPTSYNFVTGQQTGYGNAGLTGITEIGGTTVNITTNANSVTVGGNIANGAKIATNENPSGNVTVVDTATAVAASSIPVAFPGLPIVPVAGAFVTVFGGANVSVTNAGGNVNIGSKVVGGVGGGAVSTAPSGTITVVDTAPVTFDGVINGPIPTLLSGIINVGGHAVTSFGGTTVSVTSNAGGIAVGDVLGSATLEPTGSVTTVDTASAGPGNQDATAIFGGTSVTATSANGSITVGTAIATPGTNPTGNVITTIAGIETGGQFAASTTAVFGGLNVNAATTGGNVAVGSVQAPTGGAVLITDTFAGTQNADVFTVTGGVGSGTTAAVSIVTTATSGAITVGNAINPGALDSTGAALLTPKSYAAGNVSIINEIPAKTGVAGATNIYGTGATVAQTLGGTNVAIVGGGGATVTDEQTTVATGGANAGQAIGKSTLSTVVLDSAQGASTITSDALSTLYVLDDVKGDAYTVNETPAHALSLVVGNDAGAGKTTTINDAKASSLAITDNSVSTAGTIAINSGATSASIVTAGALKLNLTGSTGLTSVSIGSIGSVALGDLTGSAVAVTVAAASTGSVSALINGSTSSFVSAGSGNDTVQLNTNAVTKPVKAGSGANNTIVANYAAAAADNKLVNAVSGFTTLGFGAAANSVGGAVYDASGFNALTVGAVAGTLVISNVGAAESLAITANPGNPIFLLTNAANQTLNLTQGVDTVGTATGTTGLTSVINTSNTNILNVNSFGKGGANTATNVDRNTITINDPIIPVGAPPVTTNPTALILKGDEAVAFTAGLGVFSVIDASATTANAAAGSTSLVDASLLTASSAGITIIGGGQQLRAAGLTGLDTGTPAAQGQPIFTQEKNSYTTGTGGGQFTLGSGGGYNPNATLTLVNGSGVATTYDGVFDTGFEQVNLTASAAKSDTIIDGGNVISTFGGKNGGVTGFQNSASTAADVLNFAAGGVPLGYTVLGNIKAGTQFVLTGGSPAANMASALDPSGALANALANVSFSSVNGVITVVANGAAQPPSVDTLVKASEIIIALASSGLANVAPGAAPAVLPPGVVPAGQGAVAAVSDGAGNTYVVSATALNNFANNYTARTSPTVNANPPGISVVELLSTTNVSGFGGLGATGAIVTNAVNSLANGGAGNLGTATGKSYDDSGFSRDLLTTGAAGVTNTFNNLGTSAELDVNGGGTVLGNAVVTQVGATGGNSLVVKLQAADTLSNLTATGDYAVLLNDAVGGTTTINKLTDGTGSITSLQVTGIGASSLFVGSVSSASLLTSLDASKDTGILSLGTTGSLNTPALSFKGATGGDTLLANGASDVIAVGSASSPLLTGAYNITAAGNADVVTLTNEGGGATSRLTLAGANDTISVDSGTNLIAGGFLAQPPFGGLPPAVFNTGGAFVPSLALSTNDTVNLADGGVDTVYIGGGNSTVNLTGNAITATKVFGTAFSSATVEVQGDLVGTTSAGFATGGTAAFATVNGADTLNLANGQLRFVFNNQRGDQTGALNEGAAGGSMNNAFVNIQGAASLSAAFDAVVNQSLTANQQFGNPNGTTGVASGQVQIAANSGVVSWFQFSGNTYVVEAINNTGSAAAHVGLQAGDEVVKLSGLVNLAAANFSTPAHTLTIGGFAAIA